MTQIKICGLTRAEDVRTACQHGADALGFIAVLESPRFVTPETVREAKRGLPPFVTTVVVVRQPLDAVGYPCQTIQFYSGNASQASGLKTIRVFRIRDTASLDELREFRETPDAVLLDTYHEAALGGVGKAFDWSLAIDAKRILGDLPLVLAGGLTPENVGEAVRVVRPYAVDVASGVEAEPGRKDPEKIRRFIKAVRDADREIGMQVGIQVGMQE